MRAASADAIVPLSQPVMGMNGAMFSEIELRKGTPVIIRESQSVIGSLMGSHRLRQSLGRIMGERRGGIQSRSLLEWQGRD